MNILLSWYSTQTDIPNNKAGENGPNFDFHVNYFEKEGFNKHLLLYTSKKEYQNVHQLYKSIHSKYKNRNIDLICMDIEDPIDVNEIKHKVELLLNKFPKDNLAAFISPGTSAMTVGWYLCHFGLGTKLKLIQTRKPKDISEGKSAIEYVKISKSTLPFSAHLYFNKISEEETREDYTPTKSIQPIYDLAYKVARTDKVTTLIVGASGTGKENLAHYIHKNSSRKKKEYKTINCSSISDQLLESRLFGHMKGSFTDAKEDKRGLFQDANGGTIFLDEIGDISKFMQQSLLRVLQEGQILPVGSNKNIKVDVRVIAATNKDLPELCRKGEFRWDLYYRLSVVELKLPDLKYRGKEDIEDLINYFLEKKKKEFDRSKELKLSAKAREILINYDYPGNVRQLENLIARLYVFNEEKVTEADLPEWLLTNMEDETKNELEKLITPPLITSLSPKNEITDSLNMEEIEFNHIRRVLNLKRGNQRQTAKSIGWTINTLKSKIKKYKINLEEFM